MKSCKIWQGLIFCCLWSIAQPAVVHAQAEPTLDPLAPFVQRIALVVGNGSYRGDPLANAVNDARAMSAALRSQGFDVLHYEDATREQMETAIRTFAERLRAGGTGLFYFSGHGSARGDRTMLAPADTGGQHASMSRAHALELRTLLDAMAVPRQDALNLVILDICLTSPPKNAPTPSLSTLDAGLPDNTLVAFATTPGAFAADGSRHGTYTAHLLRTMATPGQDLPTLFRRVASGVRMATLGQQAPWVASTLHATSMSLYADVGKYIAVAEADTPAVMRSRAILPKDSEEQFELAFWESIKDSRHASDYEAYLNAYPNGRFAALARARIARLRASAPAKTDEAPAPKVVPEKPRPSRAAPAAPAAPPAPAAPSTISEIKDCPTCPVLISLPAGTFTMGSNTGDPSEKPAHQVTVRKPFAIGKYEVTVDQWNACVNAGACPSVDQASGTTGGHPVRDLSWNDTMNYVKWLNKQTGKSYRLPTEAEWEFAARGGTRSRYWWGDKLRPGMANCRDCGPPWDKDGPAPVGSFTANPYGLHDMNGSVWEWVADCWHSSFSGAPSDGSAWDQPGCRTRVIRGGSWREDGSYMPSTTRFKYDASVRHSQNGFRVARDID